MNQLSQFAIDVMAFFVPAVMVGACIAVPLLLFLAAFHY